MKTCEYAGQAEPLRRSHPWNDSQGDPRARYYDLKAEPERVRSSLEDLRPWSHYDAIQDFYELVLLLNQAGSTLESNDCAFTGPEPNVQPSIQKALECSGRVMVLFRGLVENTRAARVAGLKDDLHRELSQRDTEFAWGMIGTTLLPVRYLALPVVGNGQLGWQLMISFWAWGDSEGDTMLNLKRLLHNLSHALRKWRVGAAPAF